MDSKEDSEKENGCENSTHRLGTGLELVGELCHEKENVRTLFGRLVVGASSTCPNDDAREIPFGFAQGRLSLRVKSGYALDDAKIGNGTYQSLVDFSDSFRLLQRLRFL
jgi:hypothetical protein